LHINDGKEEYYALVFCSDSVSQVNDSTRVLISGDSSRVEIRCCEDSSHFLPIDSTQVTGNDSSNFLQNLKTSN